MLLVLNIAQVMFVQHLLTLLQTLAGNMLTDAKIFILVEGGGLLDMVSWCLYKEASCSLFLIIGSELGLDQHKYTHTRTYKYRRHRVTGTRHEHSHLHTGT